MIGDALRFPFDEESGQSYFLGATGALLATAILVRLTLELYPLVVAIGPLIGAVVSASVATGICVEAFLRPNGQLPQVRSLFRTGIFVVCIATALLLGPVLLLVWTILSYGAGESISNSGVATFFLLGSTTSIVTFLAVTYALPVVVARAVGDGGLRSITSGRPFRSILGEIAYLQGWAVGFSLATIGWWITIAGLASRTFVGLLSILFGTYCFLAGVRAVGMGYAAVPGIECGT